MSHTILYPKGHKRQFTKKAAKDLTPGERQMVDDQRRIYEMRRVYEAEALLTEIGSAKQTLAGVQ